MKRSVVIGVTGGFGTGKSTVARMFGSLGAKVLDADKMAHETILPGKAVYKKVISLFGTRVLSRNGRIDRRKLAKVVFNDKKMLTLLSGVIHPEVIRGIKAAIRPNGRVYIIDAPLLLEAGLDRITDKLVVVSTDKKTQVSRCAKKLGLSAKDIKKRIRRQMPLSKKRRLADFIIDNNGSFYSTNKEVKKIWRDIKNGRKA